MTYAPSPLDSTTSTWTEQLRKSQQRYDLQQKICYHKNIEIKRKNEAIRLNSTNLLDKLAIILDKFHKYCDANRHTPCPLRILAMPFPSRLTVVDENGGTLHQFPQQQWCKRCNLYFYPNIFYEFGDRETVWKIQIKHPEGLRDCSWDTIIDQDLLDRISPIISDLLRKFEALGI